MAFRLTRERPVFPKYEIPAQPEVPSANREAVVEGLAVSLCDGDQIVTLNCESATHAQIVAQALRDGIASVAWGSR